MTRTLLAGGVCVALCSVGMTAAAADTEVSVNAQRYNPSIGGYQFARLEEARPQLDTHYGASLALNYANLPLRWVRAGSTEPLPLLKHVVTANIVGFYDTGRIRLGLDLPIHTFSTGHRLDGEKISGTQLGDMRLSGKVWLVGWKGSVEESRFPIGVSWWLDGLLPSGAGDGWLSSNVARLQTGVSGSYNVRSLALLSSVGFRTGSGVQEAETVDGFRSSAALLWGLGASYPVSEQVRVSLELDAEAWLAGRGEPMRVKSGSAEWLGSAQMNLTDDLVARVGLGTSLIGGVGAPRVRAMLGVGWHQQRKKAPLVDQDADGIADAEDRCMNQPEDMNGIRDDDGCPDAGGRVMTRLEVVAENTERLVAGTRIDFVHGAENGSWIAEDGSLTLALLPGGYEVEFSAQGYATIPQRLEVPEQGEHFAQLVLKPPGMVSFRVCAESGGEPPRDVTINIPGLDSLSTGEDGLTGVTLPEGTYSVAFSKRGFQDKILELTIHAGDNRFEPVTLKPKRLLFVDEEASRMFLSEQITFEFDPVAGTQITESSQSLLNDLADQVKSREDIPRIEVRAEVEGADVAEAESRAETLATAVYEHLINTGLPSERLKVNAVGIAGSPDEEQSNTICPTSNERIEFHIVGARSQ